ncbi:MULTISPECIES: hypothetical protein [Paenibacillus]|uniref:hypothetical protein n=1 Tax=Paenibacillus TaxID=44249 RepID=UPI002115E253|nr:hypothetical protein [Paenibacillus odorifer]
MSISEDKNLYRFDKNIIRFPSAYATGTPFAVARRGFFCGLETRVRIGQYIYYWRLILAMLDSVNHISFAGLTIGLLIIAADSPFTELGLVLRLWAEGYQQ